MSTLNVRFPDSVHDAVKTYAREGDVSINQFIISAVIEKINDLDDEKYIEKRAVGGNEEKYLNVLKKAPHVEPGQDDI